MNLLDWCENLESQTDWAKAEFCILAGLKNVAPSCLDGLTFESKLHEAMSAHWTPTKVSSVWDGTGGEHFSEYAYTLAVHRQEPLPTYEWDMTSGCVLAHQIMYATDFGRSPMQVGQEQIDSMLTAASANDNADWIGECLIGLAIAGADIPQDRLDLVIDAYRGGPASWAEYHPYLVAEILFALLNIEQEF